MLVLRKITIDGWQCVVRFLNPFSWWVGRSRYAERIHFKCLGGVLRIHHLHILKVIGDTRCCNHHTGICDRRPQHLPHTFYIRWCTAFHAGHGPGLLPSGLEQ